MAKIRAGLLILLVAMAAVAVAAQEFEFGPGFIEPDGHGLVENSLDVDEQLMMQSEVSRRQLYRTRYISYEALKRNAVPCGRRGHSYYNCRRRRRANPYRRGCSRITYCARNSK